MDEARFPARWREKIDSSKWVLSSYFVLAALFYLPTLSGLRTFPDGDFTHHFLPFSLFQQSQLLAGRLPVWNPYTYSGHPFLADIQAAIFYPVSNGLLLLTLPWSGAGARLYFLQVEAFVHVALAGFFVYLLVRRLTGSGVSGWVAGAIFAFSGYLTGYPPVQLAILRTAIWLPLLLWLLLRAFAAPRRWARWAVVGAALSVAVSAGHPQTLLHLGYVAAAWGALLWWQCRHARWTVHAAIGMGGLMALAVAVGLSAAQLLPSLEFTRLSVRAAVDYAYVSGGFPLRDTWQLLLPGVFTQYSPLYVGVVGLGLAFFALWTAFTMDRTVMNSADMSGPNMSHVTPRTGIFFFGALGLVGLLVAYGNNGFLYPLFYRLAPGWTLFRGQERAAFVVTLALSVLAGYGMMLSAQPAARGRSRMALAWGALVTTGVYAFGLLYQLTGATTISQWHYLMLAAFTLVLAVTLGLLWWLPGWTPRRELLVMGLIVANLFWINMGTNVTPFGPVRKTILAPEMVALEGAVAGAPMNQGLPGRIFNEFRIYEDYGMRQELQDVWGSSPLRSATYAALFTDFPLDRMLDLTGVDHVLTWRHELFEPGTLLAEFPQQRDTTYLHRLVEPNPRAWLAPTYALLDDAAAMAQLADHQFDLRQVALIAPADAPLMAGLPPASESLGQRMTTGPTAAIALASPAPGRLQVTVGDQGGGILVLTENWLPGWRTLPPLPLVRTDVTLIGVVLPPGAAEFELIYRPASVKNGLRISGATLLLLVLWAGLTRRQRRANTVPADNTAPMDDAA